MSACLFSFLAFCSCSKLSCLFFFLRVRETYQYCMYVLYVWLAFLWGLLFLVDRDHFFRLVSWLNVNQTTAVVPTRLFFIPTLNRRKLFYGQQWFTYRRKVSRALTGMTYNGGYDIYVCVCVCFPILHSLGVERKLILPPFLTYRWRINLKMALVGSVFPATLP